MFPCYEWVARRLGTIYVFMMVDSATVLGTVFLLGRRGAIRNSFRAWKIGRTIRNNFRAWKGNRAICNSFCVWVGWR